MGNLGTNHDPDFVPQSGASALGKPVSGTPPTDGQILRYVAADGQYEPQTFSGSALESDGTQIQPLGAQALGNNTKAAPSNHVHAHGNQAGGALHAAANGSAAGFMSAAHYTALAHGLTAPAALAGPGTDAATAPVCRLTPGGVGDAVVLSDASFSGQEHVIIGAGSYAAGKTSVITPAHFADGTTITISAQWAWVRLKWNASLGTPAWQIIEMSSSGVAVA